LGGTEVRRISHTGIKIGKSDSTGIFHDSRTDVRKLSQAINIIIDKQKEIIDTVNRLIELQEKSKDIL
jgi:ferritin